MFKRKKKEVYGEYPCNDYLNTALRFLLDEKPNIKEAIREICWCISKGDGYFCDDVKEKLVKTRFMSLPNIKTQEDKSDGNN